MRSGSRVLSAWFERKHGGGRYTASADEAEGHGGDVDAARHADAATLSAYDPQTEAELRLAAWIISFSLQSGEALAQAVDPDMAQPRVLRLRTGAVSLSREAEKAERRLEKLREARRQNLPKDPHLLPEVESPTESGRIENPTALIGDNRKVAAYAETHGLTWSEALQRRRREGGLPNAAASRRRAPKQPKAMSRRLTGKSDVVTRVAR